MNGVEDEKGREGEGRGGERRLISEECGKEEQEKKFAFLIGLLLCCGSPEHREERGTQTRHPPA